MTKTKPTTLFWVLGIVFLVWNIFGCAMYLVDRLVSEDTWRTMENGELMIAAKAAYPIWASAAYALAVWGGLLAAIMLLLRKKLAVPLFVVSLVTAIICFIPNFTITDVKAAGGSTYWLMPLIVVGIGLFEIYWSRKRVADGTVA